MYKQVHIDGIETYLFLPEELEDILRDSSKPDEFLRCILDGSGRRFRSFSQNSIAGNADICCRGIYSC